MSETIQLILEIGMWATYVLFIALIIHHLIKSKLH